MSNKKRVLVAMSGGVDSSVAGAILKEQGYEVIGATMKIWPKSSCGHSKDRVCCSLGDIEDAKKVCDILNIRHYVLNFEDIFKKEVIDYFTKEYLSGQTPNPCIICNEKIKFGRLLKKAEELECSFISTGHYARIEEKEGQVRLKQAADKHKDQSYVLFSIKYNKFKKILLPIGGLTKDAVRVKAKKIGLHIHKKLDSQEICFVPDNNYPDFIQNIRNLKEQIGDILDSNDRALGHHKGYWNFTIGQRRGLGISAPHPLYVIDINPKENIIVVGEISEVKKKSFIVKDVNWLVEKHPKTLNSEVKIRYSHKKSQARLKDIGGGRIEVVFKEEQDAITSGQAAVFYDGEYILGGGWIEKVLNQ